MFSGSGFGSSLASFMFLWATVSQFINLYPIQRFFSKIKTRLFPQIQITISEQGREAWCRNKVYIAVETYLGTTASEKACKLKAITDRGSRNIALSMDDYEEIVDVFHGVILKWGYYCRTIRSLRTNGQDEKRYYTLTFNRRHRSLVVGSYMKHVMETSLVIEAKNRQKKLHTNSMGTGDNTGWTSVLFKHPATFDTLAMDPEKKKEILDDLITFSKSKDYYTKIGKAWKRGYLLYGPPGTGKSTMIAAIANLLDYDVYDLELTAVKCNTDLRKLLINTTNRSIVVIEDIDCSLDLSSDRISKEEKPSKDQKESEKKKKGASLVTLSGLLNFIDGLWSASGGERIIVFTTNHVDKLDPALIRRGRMDMHVELSYCSYEAFKVLAKNYLDLESHPLFETVRELLEEMEITPADVAEQLMPKTTDAIADKATGCLEQLIRMIQKSPTKKRKKG